MNKKGWQFMMIVLTYPVSLIKSNFSVSEDSVI